MITSELITFINVDIGELNNSSDCSDLGNIIGIKLAKYCKENGFDINEISFDFKCGFEHGVSIVQGSHA